MVRRLGHDVDSARDGEGVSDAVDRGMEGMAIAGIDQGITQCGFEAEAQVFMAIELPAVGEFQPVLGIIFTVIGDGIGGGRGALHDQRVSLDLIRMFISPIPGHAP